MSEKLFVYGTLKSGHYNHYLLEDIGAEKVGETITEPAYTLVDLGHFPAVYQHGETAIKGEVYEVTTLGPFDQLEGYPDFYDRIQINTEYGEAWMYVSGRDLTDEGYRVIPTGEWSGV